MIEVTNAAENRLSSLLGEEGKLVSHGLRMKVVGGGCSGLSYIIDLDIPVDGDRIQHEDGFDVYVDQKSSLYLKDSILVYNNSLQDRGFKFQNPNASNTCGCGESFAV